MVALVWQQVARVGVVTSMIVQLWWNGRHTRLRSGSLHVQVVPVVESNCIV